MSRTTIAPAELGEQLGGVGGSRALEHLRLLEALQITVATVSTVGLL
jgi:hypothetical protein